MPEFASNDYRLYQRDADNHIRWALAVQTDTEVQVTAAMDRIAAFLRRTDAGGLVAMLSPIELEYFAKLGMKQKPLADVRCRESFMTEPEKVPNALKGTSKCWLLTRASLARRKASAATAAADMARWGKSVRLALNRLDTAETGGEMASATTALNDLARSHSGNVGAVELMPAALLCPYGGFGPDGIFIRV